MVSHTDLDVNELEGLDHAALLPVWEEIIGGKPPKGMSAALMRRILAFEIQAKKKGGLPARLKRRFARINIGAANLSSKVASTQKLEPGGRLIREWNGVSHVVDVTDKGFVWQGKAYRSLSAIAKQITGARWSGPRFFGLTASVGRGGAVPGGIASDGKVSDNKTGQDRRTHDHLGHRPDTDQGARLP